MLEICSRCGEDILKLFSVFCAWIFGHFWHYWHFWHFWVFFGSFSHFSDCSSNFGLFYALLGSLGYFEQLQAILYIYI